MASPGQPTARPHAATRVASRLTSRLTSQFQWPATTSHLTDGTFLNAFKHLYHGHIHEHAKCTWDVPMTSDNQPPYRWNLPKCFQTLVPWPYTWTCEMYMGRSLHIYIEHRILETRKTLDDFFVQVRNFWLSLSLKVLRHKERDAYSFYSGFFICPPPTRVAPTTKISVSKRKPTVFPRGRSHPNSLTFFKISQNPPRASGAWRHSQSLASVSQAIVTSLSDTSARRARARTPVLMLHLTNPCAEPKGSQPN